MSCTDLCGIDPQPVEIRELAAVDEKVTRIEVVGVVQNGHPITRDLRSQDVCGLLFAILSTAVIMRTPFCQGPAPSGAPVWTIRDQAIGRSSRSANSRLMLCFRVIGSYVRVGTKNARSSHARSTH